MDILLAKSYETQLHFGQDKPFIIENLLNMVISERFVHCEISKSHMESIVICRLHKDTAEQKNI